MVDWTKKIKFKDGTPARLVGTLQFDTNKLQRLVVGVDSCGNDIGTLYRFYEDGSSAGAMVVVNDLPTFSKDNLVFLGYPLYSFNVGPATKVSDHKGLWLYDGNSIYDVVNNDEFFYPAWLLFNVGNIILFRYTDEYVQRVVSMVVVERHYYYVKVKIDDDGKVFTPYKCGG